MKNLNQKFSKKKKNYFAIYNEIPDTFIVTEMKNFPYSRQKINNTDIKAVEKVLKSDFLTQGPIVEKFEKKNFLNSLIPSIPQL